MKTTAAIISFVLCTQSLFACCMVPATYKGSIGQQEQEAILFHHDGVEDLILKIKYEIKGEKMPDRFAWVITVPNEPSAYAIADKKIFEEVFDWAEPKVQPPSKSRGHATGSITDGIQGLEFGKRARVGPYDIQPVRALGREALQGLNQWLSKNGFPAEDPDHMAYFADNGFTFLCIKISALKGSKSVDSGGDIPPLHLTFKTPEPYYPLRFSSRQGVFDVNLYVFTQQKFDYKRSGKSLEKINWSSKRLRQNVRVKTSEFPETLAKEYDKSFFKNSKAKTWRLNVLRTQGTNRGNTIASWKEDVFFKTSG